MLLPLPALGWAGGSVWSLLLCACAPVIALYSACLVVLLRCRFRLCLLSIYCLASSHDWSASWKCTRCAATGALYAPFVLLPPASLSLCFLLLAVLPALFASCVIVLVLGCAVGVWLLCYCVARQWQSDVVIARSARAVCALFVCCALSVLPLRLGSSFVGWSCLFVSCNALLVLRIAYKLTPNMTQEEEAALAVPAALRGSVDQQATRQRDTRSSRGTYSPHSLDSAALRNRAAHLP